MDKSRHRAVVFRKVKIKLLQSSNQYKILLRIFIN